jgi:hypothetical protein
MVAVTRECSIAGTSFYKGAMNIVGRLKPGSPLVLRRDPECKYDSNAIMVLFGDYQLGHLPAGTAKEFAPWVDSGGVVTAMRSKTSPGWGILTLMWDDGKPATSE